MKALFPSGQIQFTFKGLWDLPSLCGLRLIDKGTQKWVIVSELYQNNPGTSIAQVSASLAMQVCEAYDIPYSELVYVEHNPDMHSKLSFYEEEHFRVHFNTEDGQLCGPSWEKLSVEEIKKHIG